MEAFVNAPRAEPIRSEAEARTYALALIERYGGVQFRRDKNGLVGGVAGLEYYTSLITGPDEQTIRETIENRMSILCQYANENAFLIRREMKPGEEKLLLARIKQLIAQAGGRR